MAAPRSSIPPVAVRPVRLSSFWTEDSRMSFTSASVASGNWEQSMAAAALTIGAAMEVPVM